MSARMIRFIKAPVSLGDVRVGEWKSEWIGLEIGYYLPFHDVGYLANDASAPADVWSLAAKQWINPAPAEVKDHFSSMDQGHEWLAIKRTALEYVCLYKESGRPIIAAWLKKEEELLRETFLVPRSMVEILT